MSNAKLDAATEKSPTVAVSAAVSAGEMLGEHAAKNAAIAVEHDELAGTNAIAATRDAVTARNGAAAESDAAAELDAPMPEERFSPAISVQRMTLATIELVFHCVESVQAHLSDAMPISKSLGCRFP